MIGAIIGDTIGSIYEFNNIKTKDFEFFVNGMRPTDDSVLTIATAHWLLDEGESGEYYKHYANKYPHPHGGYGPSFKRWASFPSSSIAPPYNSCGNGSAMRVSPVGWAFDNEKDVLENAKRSAECTHNHPEGIKGAQATALCIFMARKGATTSEIKERIEFEFGYDLSLAIDEIRPRYSWYGMDNSGYNSVTCQGSVPQAISCALQAKDFEDAVRNAVSIGGDSDTIACIAGGIAEALFGVPDWMIEKVLLLLDKSQNEVVNRFRSKYCNK